MVLNATFNNISVISWQSVLLEEETGENHRPVVSHWQTLSAKYDIPYNFISANLEMSLNIIYIAFTSL